MVEAIRPIMMQAGAVQVRKSLKEVAIGGSNAVRTAMRWS